MTLEVGESSRLRGAAPNSAIIPEQPARVEVGRAPVDDTRHSHLVVLRIRKTLSQIERQPVTRLKAVRQCWQGEKG